MRSIIISFLLLGAGCFPSSDSSPLVSQGSSYGGDEVESEVEESRPDSESQVVLPLDVNIAGYHPIYKRFGEYFEDRFTGYHTGEDAEIPPEDLGQGEVQLVPIRAVADGRVVFASAVDGYGGVLVLEHVLEEQTLRTLYGHLDLGSSSLTVGDSVKRAQFLANLGEANSVDTDGERQHLHFSVWKGTELRLQGYVQTPEELDQWINPHDFFLKYGAIEADETFVDSEIFWYPSPPQTDIPLYRTQWGELEYSIPSAWDVEYVPSLDALNFYEISGTGSARERSQLFIRYFDASAFLTLSTVTIHSVEDLLLPQGYVARRYDIQKKTEVNDFIDQPFWRNERHIVTDLRTKDGYTRYYVVAANPLIGAFLYDEILASITIK